MTTSDVELTVYPNDCDAFGHLNQASFLSLFERARWEMLAKGPGMDSFTRAGVWPTVRKTNIDYLAPAFPGDILRFTQTLLHRGRTSFTMRQVASRPRDDAMVATAEFVFVCIDRQGKPVPVPEELDSIMVERPSGQGNLQLVVVNGVNLAVDIRGEGSAILFIHGYPLDRTIWRHQVEELKGWRRIAPDLRGFGQSDAPDLGYSIATYAADLIALLDAFDVRQAVICGLSMGGYISLELVRSHRERIKGLVLMATRAEGDSAEGRKGRDQAAALAREKGAGAIADSMLPRLISPRSLAADSGMAERLRTMMAATPVPGIIGALAAMRDRPDSTSLLTSMAGLPTLIVAGESDQLIPLADVTRLNDGIPGSVLRVVPDAAHLPPVEQPVLITQVLQEFLDALAGETAGKSRA